MEAPAPKIEANLRRTFETTGIEKDGAAGEKLKTWCTVGMVVSVWPDGKRCDRVPRKS